MIFYNSNKHIKWTKNGGIISTLDTDAKVSVIIPVYNDEKLLDKCVSSVVEQDYKNLEIILINDGSTDNSPAICEKWRQKDDRVRVLHKQNGGIGSSRNAGLAMATGEYILFVDDDDWLELDHVSSLYKILKKRNADIAIGNYAIYDHEQKTYKFYFSDKDYYEKDYTPEEWFKEEYTGKHNFRGLWVTPWAKLYKRSLFKNILYSESKDKMEDDPTTWKIYLLANKISYINKKIYIHRFINSSASANDALTKLYGTEPVAERIAFLKILGFDTSNEEMDYLNRLRISMNHALDEHNLQKYYDAKQYMEILKKYHKD